MLAIRAVSFHGILDQRWEAAKDLVVVVCLSIIVSAETIDFDVFGSDFQTQVGLQIPNELISGIRSNDHVTSLDGDLKSREGMFLNELVILGAKNELQNAIFIQVNLHGLLAGDLGLNGE